MSGDKYRDAISAWADGEDPGMPIAEIEEHLRTCESCREFSNRAHELRRRLGMYDAGRVPDLSRKVVDTVAKDDRSRGHWLTRWLLVATAAGIAAAAVPDFLAGGANAHAMRHVGAFHLAYAIGLVGVALRPARARTMLGVAVVLVGALVATTVLDVVRGYALLLDESVHLVEVASAFLVWRLTKPATGMRQLPQGAAEATTGLKVVRDRTPGT